MCCSTEVANYVWFFNMKFLPRVISECASSSSHEHLSAGLLKRIVSQIDPINISTWILKSWLREVGVASVPCSSVFLYQFWQNH